MTDSTQIKDFFKSPVKIFFLLWFPVLFSMIAEPLTGLVDTAFVARLGSEALAALGIGTVVVTGAFGLFNFLSVGCQTEISQSCGRGDSVGGKQFASQTLLIAVILGTILSILAIIYAQDMSALMGGTEAVQAHASNYIKIRSFAAPAVLFTTTSFGILYGFGDMKRPLYITLLINIANLILDPILIFGLGPIPALGINGAAIASSTSQWLGSMFCAYQINKHLGFNFKTSRSDCIKLFSIAKNLLMRSGSLILFLLLSTRAANQYGTESGAAQQAIRQVWMFSALFLDAAAVSAQSIIGYYYGSGDILRSRNVARIVSLWSFGLGFLLLLVMILGKDLFAAALVPKEAFAIFYPAWIISALVQPIAALAYVTDGIHWGTGDFKYLKNGVMIATFCGIIAIVYIDISQIGNLSIIWWIMSFWIGVRALFGILRIWPGIGAAPLGKG